jgi:hypothetical protein
MIETTKQVCDYEYATQEDRSAVRVPIAIPGYLRPVGGKRLVTTTRNISLSGFAAVALNRLTPGTRCWLTLAGTPSREATVIWWEGGIVGSAFEQILAGDDLQALINRWR